MRSYFEIYILSLDHYQRTPWKNGGGWTSDILLLPDGSQHDDFDIRISLALITQEGPFSSFPGIDRVIMRLSRTPLSLDFGNDRVVELSRLKPFSFDSALAPRSVLPEGDAQVLNVMTRRGVWRSDVNVSYGPAELRCDLHGDEMLAVHVVAGSCTFTEQGDQHHIAAGHTLLSCGTPGVFLAGHEESEAIIAKISPVNPSK